MYYILLDEVQHVPEFEDVLNSYLKIENADVYVTGSNSRFLSTDIITELASLLNIDASFKKIIIVKDYIKPKRNEDGIVTIGQLDFLLKPELLIDNN